MSHWLKALLGKCVPVLSVGGTWLTLANVNSLLGTIAGLLTVSLLAIRLANRVDRWKQRRRMDLLAYQQQKRKYDKNQTNLL